MRRRVLIESVRRRLAPGEELIEAAVMWRRHRWMLPFALVAAVFLVVVAAVVGFESTGSLIGVGLAAAGVAAMATTEYRVLAKTSRGLVLLRGSRIRQAAVELVERLPKGTTVRLVGNQYVMTEWAIGGRRYSVPKNSERAMTRIASEL